jgi:peptidoglycan hydrolase-like protein with peptidoglycan-binding domain
MTALPPSQWPLLDPNDLYRVAKGQLGYVEQGGPDGKSGNLTIYGKAFGWDGVSYCSIGVWWTFEQLHVDLRDLITKSYASAELAMEGWQRAGLKVYKTPKFMDVVFFHIPGEHAGANHTGFVIAADSGGVHTIEWNTSRPGAKGSQVNGGGVYARYRPYSLIIGYGRYPRFRAAALPKAKTYPTLKYGTGSKAHPSSAVHNMQKLLHLNPDGIYTLKVKAAVENYQTRHNLFKDGVAGPATLRAMGY